MVKTHPRRISNKKREQLKSLESHIADLMQYIDEHNTTRFQNIFTLLYTDYPLGMSLHTEILRRYTDAVFRHGETHQELIDQLEIQLKRHLQSIQLHIRTNILEKHNNNNRVPFKDSGSYRKLNNCFIDLFDDQIEYERDQDERDQDERDQEANPYELLPIAFEVTLYDELKKLRRMIWKKHKRAFALSFIELIKTFQLDVNKYTPIIAQYKDSSIIKNPIAALNIRGLLLVYLTSIEKLILLKYEKYETYKIYGIDVPELVFQGSGHYESLVTALQPYIHHEAGAARPPKRSAPLSGSPVTVLARPATAQVVAKHKAVGTTGAVCHGRLGAKKARGIAGRDEQQPGVTGALVTWQHTY